MHRRRFIHAATIAAAAPMTIAPVRAEVATPAVEDDATLAGRLAAIAPDTLLEALLTTPVATPLLPRDTPTAEPVPWDDESDTDLQGAVGGVLFQTGTDIHDNPLVFATAIVMPDSDGAASRFGEVSPAEVQELYGLPFFALDFGDYAVAVVRVGYLLLAGGAEGPGDAGIAIEGPGATPAAAGTSGRHHLRALANLAAALDHTEDVLATIGG